MPDKNSTATSNRATAETDAGQAEVAERLEAEQEQGFQGVKVDPTPNEAYTVKGVTSGQPTPETDADAFEKARKAAGLR